MPNPFDGFRRELKIARPQTIRVPIATDPKGYLDKECPAATCRFSFKVHADDWAAIFRDESVFCPRCGHEAPADQWWTQEQVDHLERVAMQKLSADVDRALRRGAQDFNRRFPRSGFVQMSMRVTGSPPMSIVLPARARDILEQELMCDHCRAHYAVIGTAFFCPSCGHNGVERLFDEDLAKLLTRLEGLDDLRRALTDSVSRDHADDMCRFIVEASLQDGVTAFQSLCDHLYRHLPGKPLPRRNAFQNLDEGGQLWKNVVGLRYADILTHVEARCLAVAFQKRHLLAHRKGMVDQDYIDRSADHTYRVGQRVVVAPDEVLAFVRALRRLADGIRGAIPAARSADGAPDQVGRPMTTPP